MTNRLVTLFEDMVLMSEIPGGLVVLTTEYLSGKYMSGPVN